jgi:hypothetical protein
MQPATEKRIGQSNCRTRNLFRNENAKEEVVKILNQLLPTFQHVETGLNLDQKM